MYVEAFGLVCQGNDTGGKWRHFALIFAVVHSRPSLRHCDKKSIAKRSHANVRSDFRNQTFARERLAVDFLVRRSRWTTAGQARHLPLVSLPWSDKIIRVIFIHVVLVINSNQRRVAVLS